MNGRRVQVCGALPVLLALLFGRAWGYDSFPMVQGFVPDARAGAMGGAYTAVAEGTNGVWWNPGGLARVRHWQAGPFGLHALPSVYGHRLRVRSYGASGRVGRIGVGLHLSRLRLEDADGLLESESSWIAGAGVDLVELIRRAPDRHLQWGVGFGLKRNAIHYPQAVGPQSRNWSAWDLDLGTLARLERPLDGLPVLRWGGAAAARPSYLAGRFGLHYRNVFDARIGPYDDPMGRTFRAGIGAEAGLVATPPFGHLLRLLATLETETSITQKDLGRNPRFGLETRLLGTLAWRYGEFDDHYRLWIGTPGGDRAETRNDRGVAHGIGLRLGGERLSVSLDYARILRAASVDRKLYTMGVQWTP